MKSDAAESSPAKAVIDALATAREEFRTALDAYAERIDSDISRIQEAVQSEAGQKKTSHAKLRDLRDMLTLLRKCPPKAGKGRRKDLKKFDALVEDLAMLIENWSRE